MLPLALDMDPNNIHVQAPSAIILLCGGKCGDIGSKKNYSLRDAFLKINDIEALRGKDLILAEEITKLSFFIESYQDFLQFEIEFAQITELIILFCESEGSYAELGAFCTINEISSRLFVVIRDKYWKEESFIKLGPLRSIENNHGKKSIFVVDDKELNIKDRDYSGLDLARLKHVISPPLKERLGSVGSSTSFKKSSVGHIIKLMVGLIQEYGALTFDEIDELLLICDVYVYTPDLKGYLLCAEAVRWIEKKRKGSEDYYFAYDPRPAASIKLKPDVEIRNRERRRAYIRDYWMKNDIQRFGGIADFVSETVSDSP